MDLERGSVTSRSYWYRTPLAHGAGTLCAPDPLRHPGRMSTSGQDGDGQFHFDPTTYMDMMLQEVPDYRDLQRHLADATKGVEASMILDLGVGTGETTSAVAAVHPDARIVGIDESEPMLERARAPPERRPPGPTSRGNSSRGPVRPRRFGARSPSPRRTRKGGPLLPHPRTVAPWWAVRLGGRHRPRGSC